MRFGLIVGLGIVAAASLAVADPPRVLTMGRPHHAVDLRGIDANGDGWMTRNEASAAAERLFGELDTNDDGKLDAQDRAHRHARVVEHRVMRNHAQGGEGKEDVVIMHRECGPHASQGEAGGRAKAAVQVPHPPMAMMMVHSSEEADRNSDGALSREEFRAQHLRFFEASDGNGDGRIRFRLPELPEPPTPPNAPAPPQPPAPPQAPQN